MKSLFRLSVISKYSKELCELYKKMKKLFKTLSVPLSTEQYISVKLYFLGMLKQCSTVVMKEHHQGRHIKHCLRLLLSSHSEKGIGGSRAERKQNTKPGLRNNLRTKKM